MVVVPGKAGELGVLPRHIPLIAQLKPGETRVRTVDDQWLAFATGAGLLQGAARPRLGAGRERASRPTSIDANGRAATSRTPSAASPRRRPRARTAPSVARAERDIANAENRLKVAGVGSSSGSSSSSS